MVYRRPYGARVAIYAFVSIRAVVFYGYRGVFRVQDCQALCTVRMLWTSAFVPNSGAISCTILYRRLPRWMGELGIGGDFCSRYAIYSRDQVRDAKTMHAYDSDVLV